MCLQTSLVPVSIYLAQVLKGREEAYHLSGDHVAQGTENGTCLLYLQKADKEAAQTRCRGCTHKLKPNLLASTELQALAAWNWMGKGKHLDCISAHENWCLGILSVSIAASQDKLLLQTPYSWEDLMTIGCLLSGRCSAGLVSGNRLAEVKFTESHNEAGPGQRPIMHRLGVVYPPLWVPHGKAETVTSGVVRKGSRPMSAIWLPF